GQLTPLVQASSTSASATASQLTSSQGPSCAPSIVPAPLNAILSLDAACSKSLAEIVGGAPHAYSEGSVAGAALQANTVLSQLNAVVPITQTLTTALQPIVDQVNGVLSQSGQSIKLDPAGTLDQLLTDLTQTTTLGVKLGQSTSDVSTSATQVTALATDA